MEKNKNASVVSSGRVVLSKSETGKNIVYLEIGEYDPDDKTIDMEKKK
jgi:hypothetical protein